MCISIYFFTREKKFVGNHTLFQSIKVTTRFHLGTAAFGSLIIAIIQVIRSIVIFIEKTAAKRKDSGISKIILKMMRCCLWCVEKFMKFVNKQAYIQTAMLGHSFCKAARCSFTLIMKNILRVSAVSMVAEFVLLTGKLFVVVVTTTGAYIYLDDHFEDELNGLWLPVALVSIISYFIAQMFSEVFGMAISTILQCFIVDEELFEQSERFARKSLTEVIDKTNLANTHIVHPNNSFDE